MRRFEGWEPAEVHEHEYDGDRLVRTVVTREAEWDEYEQGLMLALTMYRAQTCPSGHWLPEAAAKAAEGEYTAEATRCHACTAIALESERVRENPQSSALLFGVDRRR